MNFLSETVTGSFQAGIGKPGTQNLDLARSEKEALF
jgi:hypothetical protein